MQAESSSPSWLRAYRAPMERSRVWYHSQVDHLDVTESARLKYTPEGQAKPFPGLSLVFFLDVSSAAFAFLKNLSGNVRKELEQAGIAHPFAFLPEITFHLTVADLITRPNGELEQQIVEALQKSFQQLRQERLSLPHLYFRGDPVVSAGTSIVVLAEPKDRGSLRTIQHIREAVYRNGSSWGEALPTQNPPPFIGHATIAYIVQPLAEHVYARFKRVMQLYANTTVFSSDFALDRLELRRFASMEEWGKAALAELQLRSNL